MEDKCIIAVSSVCFLLFFVLDFVYNTRDKLEEISLTCH